MPVTKSAKKRMRADEGRRLRKRSIQSLVKTNITKAERLTIEAELEPAREAVAQTLKTLDKAAQKGIIHPNNAARRKSRLMKRFNTTFPSA